MKKNLSDKDVCVLCMFTSLCVGGHVSSWVSQHIVCVGVQSVGIDVQITLVLWAEIPRTVGVLLLINLF